MSRNYQQFKIQLLQTVLKNKATSPISRKMGYSFDKVRRWANGSKQLRWNEFCDLCILLKAPLLEALASSLGIVFVRKKDAYGIVSHLKTFSGIPSTKDLSKTLNVSASALQRYINQDVYPDVEFVIEMIDLRANFLETFMENFSGTKRLDVKSILSLPWTAAVSNAASLKAHMSLKEHSSKWIGDFLGLTEEQVNEAIQLLVSLKLIEREGSHYRPTLSRTIGVPSLKNSLEYSRFIRFWLKRAEGRFNTSTGEPINVQGGANKDCFRIFSASSESACKISEVITKAEQEIHDLLLQDTHEKTDVRVLLFHHFSAQDFAKK